MHTEEEHGEKDRILLSHHTYQIVLEDHGHGEGTIMNPRTILRMRVKRKEVAWLELQFESKAQSHQSYSDW